MTDPRQGPGPRGWSEDADEALLAGFADLDAPDEAALDALLGPPPGRAPQGAEPGEPPAIPDLPELLVPGAADRLPPARRQALIAALRGRRPGHGGDLEAVGRLAASLARTAPDAFGPDEIAAFEAAAPAVRGFVRGLDGLAPGARAGLLHRLPAASRKAMVDELAADGEDLADVVALTTSLIADDAELAAEVLERAGPDLAAGVVAVHDDEALVGLPAPVFRALAARCRLPESEARRRLDAARGRRAD